VLFNPFSPGPYSPVQGIFGREEQVHVVEQAAAGIENGVPHAPVCFTGPPGVGKTFLLRNIASQLRDRGWLCGYTEAGPDISSAIHDILADAREMAPRRSSTWRLVTRVTGVNATAPGFSLGLTLQDTDNGSAYTQLVRLFREISGKAGSDFTGAALLLDEAQVLPDAHLSELFRALAKVEDSRIVLFMAALPGLAGTISSMAQSPASWRRRLSTPYVQFSPLGALDPASAGTVLAYQAGTAGGELEPEAAAALADFSLGHPMTLQMSGVAHGTTPPPPLATGRSSSGQPTRTGR
jgi:hypothetical protein